MTDTSAPARTPSDAELLTGVRGGNEAAYGVLYERHASAARAAARSLTRSSSDADDLVSEAFARVLRAIKNGGGPEVAFRPYLVSAVRNAFYDRARHESRVEVTDELEDRPNVRLLDAAAGRDDRDLVARAFASLPERWQLVLWHTEVEGRPAAEVAPLIGLAPNAVAALAYRAREGLREAYLQAHLELVPPERCREPASRLGAYVRNGLSPRERRRVDEHLESCERCQGMLGELQVAATGLRGVLVPILIGVPASTYLGHLVGGKGLAALVRWRPRSRRAQAGAAAAVVAAVLAASVGVYAMTGSHTDPPQAAPTVPSSSSAPAPTPTVRVTAAQVTSPPPARPVTGTTRPAVVVIPPPTAPPVVLATTTTARRTTTTVRRTTTTVRRTTTTTRPPSTTAGTTTTTAGTTTTSTTVAPIPQADVSLSASPVGYARGGHAAFVTVSLANAGPAAANPVVLRLALTGVIFDPVDQSPSPGWQCSSGGSANVVCVGALAAPTPPASTGALLVLGLKVPLTAGGPSIMGRPLVRHAAVGQVQASIDAGTGYANITKGATSQTVSLDTGSPSPLLARVAHGDVTIAGNALLTCDPADKACAGALAEDVKGTSNNGTFTMVPLDTDVDPATVVSSNATLALTPGATVAKAWLVWGGHSGDPKVTLDRTGIDAVTLTTPKGISVSVGADPASVEPPSADPTSAVDYYARADVTTIVQDAGAGTYTFGSAGFGSMKGTNLAAGWSLVVAYDDPAAPLRLLTVLDGLVTAGGAGAQATTVTFGGLGPIAAGQHGGTVGFVAWDGDRGNPDKVTVKAGTAIAVSDADHPEGDVFNSTVADRGVYAPGVAHNTLGFDASLITLPAPLVGADQSLGLTIDAPSDVIRVGVVTFAVDL
jgi:RNA polymerase sigma factor (sigma-70 family)